MKSKGTLTPKKESVNPFLLRPIMKPATVRKPKRPTLLELIEEKMKLDN
jgi:hypothetical protein